MASTQPMPASAASTTHLPVLLAEVIALLQPRSGGRYLDGTLGGGGHAAAILDASQPDGQLLGLDRDPTAVARAATRLAPYGERATLATANFADLGQALDAQGWQAADGILLDLGFSSHQIDDAARGLSFQREGPLDMRLGPDAESTAAELVNTMSESELADIIYQYGEEPRSRRIARALVAARPLQTTTELAEIVRRAIGGRHGDIHPATQTFQALRIAVNAELAALAAALPVAIDRLATGGRLAVISFHSLEDRLVKQTFALAAKDCICPPKLPLCACGGNHATMRLVTRRPITAQLDELASNPRARSAKLRAAERLPRVQPGQTKASVSQTRNSEAHGFGSRPAPDRPKVSRRAETEYAPVHELLKMAHDMCWRVQATRPLYRSTKVQHGD